MSLYQISNDNPQKDNFHNLIFRIDKMVTFGIVDSAIRTRSCHSKGVDHEIIDSACFHWLCVDPGWTVVYVAS